MSSQVKRRFRNVRTEFKHDLRDRCEANRPLAMLFVKHRAAWHHRRHITKIWSMYLNPEYDAFYQAYNQQLFGEYLTGSDDFWRTLYFADKELFDKYHLKIPETFAMGDALGVAYGILNRPPTQDQNTHN